MDGTHLRSLHWTGHYIPDPTLAIATTSPFDVGQYQALGFAKVWSGKARIPDVLSMWCAYPGAGNELVAAPALGGVMHRLFVTWLNEASLEFGGRLIGPLSHQNYEAQAYFAASMGLNIFTTDYYNRLENMPRSEWPSRNGEPCDKTKGLNRRTADSAVPPVRDEWMYLSEKW